MKILFMGTPTFAVPSLTKLVESRYNVVGVFSQPDRPAGRSHKLTPPPVKQLALMHHLPVYSPQNIRADEIRETIARNGPDVIVVVAYGKILPQWMLEIPRYGAINVHASLLPKYRGAAPIQWAVANGETVTGVTTVQMDSGLDTGDILLQRKVVISPEDNAQTLHDRLSGVGADLLMESLEGIRAGSLHPREQDSLGATLAPILKKEDGRLDWSWAADRIHNYVRGLNPWPGTFTTFRGGYLRVWKTEILPEARDADLKTPPGTLIHRPHSVLLVQTGGGAQLGLLEVQPAGHRHMSGIDFLNGFRITAGEGLI